MFRIETTNSEGETISAITVTRRRVWSELVLCFQIESEQTDFAIQVTESNPGVPYDLHRLDENGDSIEWTGRLTKLQNSH